MGPTGQFGLKEEEKEKEKNGWLLGLKLTGRLNLLSARVGPRSGGLAWAEKTKAGLGSPISFGLA